MLPIYPFTGPFFQFLSKTRLFLSSDVTTSLQDFSKEDVEAFLNRQEDEAGHHGAQVVDDVVDPLVSKAENVQEGHDVALALRQDLLQEGLLKEAPCKPGQSPVNQRLQATDEDSYQACLWWEFHSPALVPLHQLWKVKDLQHGAEENSSWQPPQSPGTSQNKPRSRAPASLCRSTNKHPLIKNLTV